MNASKALRVLFVVPYVPDLVRVRSYQFLRHLAACGHEITLATLWQNETERAALDELRPLCARVMAAPLSKALSLSNCLAALPSRTPLQAVFCWQPELDQMIRQAAGGGDSFDVVHVEHLRGVRYGLSLKESARAGRATHPAPVIWDSVDSISHLFRQAARHDRKLLRRLVLGFDLPRTERYEGWLPGQFDRTLVTSELDRQALLALSKPNRRNAEITVLPNGVDLDYFQPDPTAARQPATLVISGKMSYHANQSMVLHFARHILPQVKARRPDVKLWIVGKDPSKEILSLKQEPGITVTGTVADLRPYLQTATLAVAPLLYGAGIQNKILEAMACRTPVIAYPLAVSALNLQPDKEVIIAKDATEFVEKIVALLEDPALQEQVGSAGFQFVQKHHRWETIVQQLEGVYYETVHPAARKQLD